jgi:methyl-accepting chemotaxis protein
MAGIDDISKKLEELQKQIKLIAKDVELGNVEVDKEKIKSLEKELSIWEKRRDAAKETGDLVADEEKKTAELLKTNKQLLRNLKDSATATGQIYNKVAAAGSEFTKFVKDTSKQLSLAQDMARQYKSIEVLIGQTGVSAKFLEKSFKGAAPAFKEMGLSFDDVGSTIQTISEATGRVSNLTEKDLISIGSIAGAMDMTATQSAEMTESFMLMGLSSEQIEENIFETYKSAQSMGLNARKVIDVLRNNIKSMQSYSFANGVKGMTEMAKLAVKMRMDVGQMLQMADKFYNPEGAIEAAAELQLLGGDIAEAFGDPFETMYLARNKPEELAKKVSEMTENMLQFNEETGEYELPAEARMQFQALDKQLGLGVDNMIEMSRQAAKIGDIKMKFTSVGDDEMKESLASIAKFKDGKFVIETEEFGDLGLDQVTDDMAKTIMEEQQTSEESLRDVATNTKVMADRLENLQAGAQAKVAGLTNIYEVTADEVAPLIDSMKDSMDSMATEYIKKADVFINDMFKGEAGDKTAIDSAMEEMGNLATEIKDGTIKSLKDLTTAAKELEETLDLKGGDNSRGTEDFNIENDFIMRSSGEVTSFTSQDDIIGAKRGGPIDRLLSGSIPSNDVSGGVPSKVEFGSINITGRIELVSPDGSTNNIDMASIKPMVEKTIISHLNGRFRNGGVPSSKESTDYMAV